MAGILAIPLVTGCASSVAYSPSPAEAKPPAAAAASPPRHAPDGPNLYVGEGNHQVIVYAGHSRRVLRRIAAGIEGPRSLAFDSAGNLYVANCFGMCFSDSSVTVYPNGSSNLALRISNGIDGPYGLAFDASDNLYVANAFNNTVTVYAPGQTQPSRTISSGLNWPLALAIDKSGNLYVANLSGAVQVFAPGGSAPIRTISEGPAEPRSLAFDHRWRLFVGSCGPYVKGRVNVYSAAHSKLIGTISEHLLCAGRIFFGHTNDLYVVDGTENRVQVYRSSDNLHWKLLRTISRKMSNPYGAVLDSSDHLFVINCRISCAPPRIYVTVYSPESGALRETLRALHAPESLAFGP
jgi:DNA-binding beta-propeller fold protein YncE